MSIQQEDITIVNICAPNLGAPKYIKQLTTNLKELIDNSTIIVRDFNSPLTAMDNKETRALNDTLDQMNFTDIFRVFHPKATEYTFFSSAHGIFSRIVHILSHKSGLNWYQKTGIIPCIFLDHNALKLELKHKKKFGKNSNTGRLKSILLKNGSNMKSKKNFKKSWKQMKMKTHWSKTYGTLQRQS